MSAYPELDTRDSAAIDEALDHIRSARRERRAELTPPPQQETSRKPKGPSRAPLSIDIRSTQARNSRCPYCHSEARGAAPSEPCEHCGASQHRACWLELGRCAACNRTPGTNNEHYRHLEADELDALMAAHVLNLSGAETIAQLRAPPRLRKRLRRRLQRGEHEAVLERLRFEPLEDAQLLQLNSHLAHCQRCLKHACARVRAPRGDRTTADGSGDLGRLAAMLLGGILALLALFLWLFLISR